MPVTIQSNGPNLFKHIVYAKYSKRVSIFTHVTYSIYFPIINHQDAREVRLLFYVNTSDHNRQRLYNNDISAPCNKYIAVHLNNKVLVYLHLHISWAQCIKRRTITFYIFVLIRFLCANYDNTKTCIKQQHSGFEGSTIILILRNPQTPYRARYMIPQKGVTGTWVD